MKTGACTTRYVYPAVFEKEDSGLYSIYFPDLEGCYTCGDDLGDGIKMAEDALAMVLYNYEKDHLPIPKPSEPKEIKLNGNDFINFIVADTMFYHRKFDNKAVKKTLSIPEWLNNLATAENVNFSQVLQEALIKKLHVPV